LYLANAFVELRADVLQTFMAEHPFATLICTTREGVLADHLPLLLEAARGPHGTLIGHLARANPLARFNGQELAALAIFSGPHAYISPSWYVATKATGEVVPTWNYAVTHAEGILRFFEDRERLHDLVNRLTMRHERQREQPWHLSSASPPYVGRQLGAITGFEIELTRLTGKFKASQNRSEEDRAGVRRGLAADGFAAGAIGELVRAPRVGPAA
jgi:transcriptional regulator